MLRAVSALLVLPALAAAQTIEITTSQRVKLPEGKLVSSSVDKPAIRIRGNNLSIDFGGQSLTSGLEKEQATGLGIEVIGKNVTIKNLKLSGYRVGLLAKNAPGLKLINCHLTDLYKPRLLSTPEAEDLSDWMSYHQNEKGEWLEKGAGVVIDTADNVTIEGCSVTESLNGLMLSRVRQARVTGSDFSRNSGVGIALYRTSESVIANNRVDFNLRGYSHGIYNRGQDSAGILLFEQCNENTVAFNSVTHSGDGLFLWAGQTTMDSGEGGCNDNIFAYNDFSHAPTNGIEATFSRNQFVGNLVMECWHGVWGGFSYDSLISGNIFAYNGQAIAIEHGQDNRIAGNSFWRDAEGVVLWAKAALPADWGYAKKRDCRSRDANIATNRFEEIAGAALSLSLTTGAQILQNQFASAGQVLKATADSSSTMRGNAGRGLPTESIQNLPGGTNDWQTSSLPILAYSDKNGTDLDPLGMSWEERKVYDRRWDRPLAEFRTLLASPEAKDLATKLKVKAEVPKLAGPRGRRVMVVGEWGPVATSATTIVARPKRGAQHTIELLGNAAPWNLVRQAGGPPVKAAGNKPELIKFSATEDQWAKMDFTIRTEEAEVRFREGSVALPWDVQFFRWDKDSDPRTATAAFRRVLGATPLKTVKLDRLWLGTNGAPTEGVPSDYFATVATADVSKIGGEVELSVTADDGVRVWLDDDMIMDEWRYQGPTNFRKTIKLDGKKTLRIEHFEIDGYTALQVKLRRR
ncbi:MAG: right-handed parallel beta-helix repeat-containing protein [Chthonomonas sp.]|nr:right-handed parallel beta-helix repeat-containing protein [Chthonomonas sp.]